MHRDPPGIALQNKPNDAGLHENLAKALRSEKRYADAIPHYEKALAFNDRNAGAWFDLGYCYEQTKQKDKAASAYKKHLELARLSGDKGAEHLTETIKKLVGK